ncbi:hypothetical protein FQN53_000630 [Emmonsiellopsis sp. PD_33]|nr:hypothetical protein FQN53_000630 [Emmonsiellopsis sp. PD_33]
MSIIKPAVLLGALASIALVDAHGHVTGILADGNYFGGYLVDKYPYTGSPPAVAGWSTTATDNGFVDASGYSTGDIICHKNAKPGAAAAEIAAGGTIELHWTEWPESHHGPVLDYLANCNGDCSSVDKSALEFFKIQESGLNVGSSAPGNAGKWASDDLIANNNTWTLTIPESIAPGNYVLRHEIIALHSAGQENGAQNYPQCLNLKITGSGTAKPAGTVGTELYKGSDPGILVNIYQSMDKYEIPGPALFNDGGEGSDPTEPSAAPSSSASPSSPATGSPAPPASTTTTAAPSTTNSPTPTPSQGKPTVTVTVTAGPGDVVTSTATVTVDCTAGQFF